MASIDRRNTRCATCCLLLPLRGYPVSLCCSWYVNSNGIFFILSSTDTVVQCLMSCRQRGHLCRSCRKLVLFYVHCHFKFKFLICQLGICTIIFFYTSMMYMTLAFKIVNTPSSSATVMLLRSIYKKNDLFLSNYISYKFYVAWLFTLYYYGNRTYLHMQYKKHRLKYT